MRERLGVAVELAESGADESDLNVIASPVQDVRSVFDLMPTDTAEQWATVAARLRAVPTGDAGLRALARQRRGAVRRLAATAGRERHRPVHVVRRGGGFLRDLRRIRLCHNGSARAARCSRSRLRPGSPRTPTSSSATSCATSILPKAPAADGCGREKYAMWSRAFVGAAIDFDEAYAWGQDELARIVAEMEATAEVISPGGSVREAMHALDIDPANVLHGTDGAAAAGCSCGPTRRSASSTRPTSTSRSRCAPSSAGSRRPTRAASTTPPPATTSRGRAGCGGRCPRASTRSRPGAS